jgi:glycosyltransferase involved in cell wall biosynthesis
VDRRILFLLTDLEIGGTPTVVREIAARLNDPPHVAVTVACLAARGPVADQIEKRGVSVAALNARGSRDLRVIRRLAQLIHRERFDTVVSFLVHANCVAALVATASPGVRFFQSIQTTQRRPHWHWFMQRFAQRMAQKIIVPSPSVASMAREWAGVREEKIVVIPNGVDVPPVQPPLAPAASPHRVVFLGRLDPIKRLPDLLAAIALLNGFARLDVYGEGEERPRLMRQMEEMNLGQRVTLHGAISDPAAALQNAELLVLPSEAEGFGLVLIEAMAAGVPVVATDAPGIRDVVRDGETGLLVPVSSPTALAGAIRRVLEDETLRRALSAAAFADVSRRFTWEIAVEGFRRTLEI